MNLTLRQRKKGNKISLYLDYYHEGKRTYEYLKLYLIPELEKKKLTKEEKEHNRQTLALAEAIKSKRLIQIKNEEYGFRDTERAKGSFIAYFEILTQKRRKSRGNWGNWDSALKHLKRFIKKDILLKDINKDWLESFKDYLQFEARMKNNKKLSINSQSSYFNKVIATLKEAIKEGILQVNPANQVDRIKADDVNREFLTIEELQAAVKVKCEIPILKTAFIFSCLTGLRWSDIEKLIWSEVHHSEQVGYYIRFKQKKTKGAETLPISEKAYELMGKRKKGDENVFKNLCYSGHNNKILKNWLAKAGITKNISFHCARHTYATLQLSVGTDIYTVSKLLGHKSFKTTEIYAKVIDKKKIEAANKIKLDF